MEIQALLLILQAANQLAPQVTAALAKGEITPAQQAELASALAAIRAHGFDGPEWQISAAPAAATSSR